MNSIAVVLLGAVMALLQEIFCYHDRSPFDPISYSAQISGVEDDEKAGDSIACNRFSLMRLLAASSHSH
jgi:hypothetical protein